MVKNPFVPRQLPFDTTVINQMVFINELVEANSNVTKYQTLLNSSPIDSQLLLNPVLLKEAIQSTKIEGTQVTLDEVLEVEADERQNNKDVQEVFNYHRALIEGKMKLESIPISTRLFKFLHSVLMSNEVRGSNRSPGEFRKIQNFIGPPGCTIKTANFIPPEPQLVDNYMSNLEEYINNPSDDLNPLIRIAIIHAQFETIHPFLDGNGRIGRILIPLYLFNKGVIDYPNLYISDTLERDKHKYYGYLNDTRFKDDWNQWIKFFLNCISEQSIKNIKFIEEINHLYNKDLQHVKSIINAHSASTVFDSIFKMPIFKTKHIAKMTGLSEPTCRRILTRLENEKIIFSNNRSRSKTYYYYNLLDKLR